MVKNKIDTVFRLLAICTVAIQMANYICLATIFIVRWQLIFNDPLFYFLRLADFKCLLTILLAILHHLFVVDVEGNVAVTPEVSVHRLRVLVLLRMLEVRVIDFAKPLFLPIEELCLVGPEQPFSESATSINLHIITLLS